MRAALLAAGIATLVLGGCKAEKKEAPAAIASTPSFAPTHPGATEGDGRVSGAVYISSPPPARHAVKMNAQPYCLALHPNGRESEEIVARTHGELKDAIVFVSSGLPDLAYPAPAEPIVLTQTGCWYEPHVLSVSVGQPLRVVNADATMHNIHGRPSMNQPFNFSQPGKGMSRDVVFLQPELPVPLKCDVHGWMNAWVGVFSHPFHAVTGADGAFNLAGLPEGTLEITCWHPKMGSLHEKITVQKGRALHLDFRYPVARLS